METISVEKYRKITNFLYRRRKMQKIYAIGRKIMIEREGKFS